MRDTTTMLACGAALVVALLTPGISAGVIESYWNVQSGFFDDPASWNGPVPDETVAAVFDIDLDPGPFVAFRADAVSNRIVIRDGSVFLWMWETDKDGQDVSHSIEVTNSNITTPSIVVAEIPAVDASLSIDYGAVTTRSTVIGHGAGSVGTLAFGYGPAGLSASLNCELQLHVGGGGHGILVIDDDATVTTDVLTLGLQPGSLGEIEVTDPDASLTAAGPLTVGLGGAGVLDISNQSDVVSGLVQIGRQPFSSGTVTVSGLGATWTMNGPMDVGYQGQGSLAITDGVVLTDGFAALGTFPEPGIEPITGGTGAVTISGPTAFWGINGDLYVGLLWEGSLNIYGGAAVTSDNGYINVQSDQPCQATLQGPGSAWSNIGELVVAGDLYVYDGAMVIAETVQLQTGANVEGDGTILGATESDANIRPGNPVGMLAFDGELVTTGPVHIEIESPAPGAFDSIAVNGSVIVAGPLYVTNTGAHEFQFGDAFEILSADAVFGDFGPVNLPELTPPLIWFVNHDSDSVTLFVSTFGDLDGDGIIGVTDFLAMLAAWGPCPAPPDPCPADFNADGMVGVEDFLILLALWT